MQQSCEMNGAKIERVLVGRLVVNVVRETDDTLDVAPVVGRVVVAHVPLYVGRDGLDEGVIAEGVHFELQVFQVFGVLQDSRVGFG